VEWQENWDRFWSPEHGGSLTWGDIPPEPAPEPPDATSVGSSDLGINKDEEQQEEGFSWEATLKTALAHFYFPVALLSNVISPVGLHMDVGTILAGMAGVWYFWSTLSFAAIVLSPQGVPVSVSLGVMFLGGGIVCTYMTYRWYKTHPEQWPWNP